MERINSKKKSLSKRPPAPGKPKLKPKPVPSLPRCKTIYPYDATDVDELSFQPDEIIEIVKEGNKDLRHSCITLLQGDAGDTVQYDPGSETRVDSP